ncbi:MAG TPA: methyltransferase [Gemmataceae bacterium]|nr:methyltransferase [Gemmataceae bacterium]
MNRTLLTPPRLDPTPIFELHRSNYAAELLTAAVSHFRIFDRFVRGPKTAGELRADLGLEERPAVVLLTALRAFGLLKEDGLGRLDLSELARDHLTSGGPFDVSDYIRLGADNRDVSVLVERLRSNRPAGTASQNSSAAYTYQAGVSSPMDQSDTAERLTLALAGRARNVAPALAERVPMGTAKTLLDVGGGTGLYSIAFLQKNPGLRAIVWDRPEVLNVTAKLATEHGVADRLECLAGDMFTDRVPPADVVLLSNVLHDWNVPECRRLISRCAAALPRGGRLLIHDVFLNDALDGPLPIALYSAALFCVTEGRAYSAAEYRSWQKEAGLTPGPVRPTLIHCGVLPAVKEG